MAYLWFKAFHIVFMVSWMAGLFYLVRLFVYHADANREGEPRRGILAPQYALMEARLYGIITTPAMVLTWITAAGMLWLQPGLLGESWMHIKIFLVLLLSAYHGLCKKVMRELQQGSTSRTGEFFRVANEGPTLVLVLVSVLVIFKREVGTGQLVYVLAGVVLSIYAGFKAYAMYRLRHPER
jgi:protoporphyrinogen IX oxidase